MAFDSKYALNDAIRYLTKVAERRAAGGWVPPKERERQQREAMRQEQQQARHAEKQQKEAARAEEKQQREAERQNKEHQKLLSKQFPTQYMPNVGRQVMADGGKTTEERQQDATDMNFNPTVLYHAGHSDFPQFQLQDWARTTGEKAHFFTTDPAVADSYLGGQYIRADAPDAIKHGVAPMGNNVGRIYAQGAQVYPVRIRDVNEDTFHVYDMGGGSYNPSFMKQALNEAKRDKKKGIVLMGVKDPGMFQSGPLGSAMGKSNLVAVFDKYANHIRSVNAQFNPKDKNSRDLLKSEGGEIGRQVMNTGGTPDQPQRQLSPMGFYSAAAERASTLQPSGDAVQMVNALKNTQGIKTEELQNAGLIDESGNVHPDWAGRGKVTRDELVSHLQGQMPQVEETVLGGRRSNYQPKYEQYTLPGGENYREVLLKLPNLVDPSKGNYTKTESGLWRVTWADGDTSVFKTEQQAKDAIGSVPAFRSSHWDDPNVLAHIRMSDRIGPNGEKILHVEELQSDWGQKGKKEGFLTDEMKRQAEDAQKNFSNYANDLRLRYEDSLIDQTTETPVEMQKQLIRKITNQMTTDDIARKMGEYEKFNNLESKSYELENSLKGLPSAPYVTSTEGWTDLALKRVLKEAAEGGYDKIVWTPGAEQAKRYDLSRHVDRVEYQPETKTLIGVKDGKPVFDKTVEPQKIEDYVGKDVAKKLLEQPITGEDMIIGGFHSLAGQDLSVGGEGMKGYYDSIVPKRLQNLAKKHDKNARLGFSEASGTGRYEVVLPNGKVIADYPDKVSADAIARRQQGATVRSNNMSLPSLDVTPTMRESILRGQSAYKRGGAVSKKHPALSIAGTHIREETHGEPIFTGRL